jgi:hypothetical protein
MLLSELSAISAISAGLVTVPWGEAADFNLQG